MDSLKQEWGDLNYTLLCQYLSWAAREEKTYFHQCPVATVPTGDSWVQDPTEFPLVEVNQQIPQIPCLYLPTFLRLKGKDPLRDLRAFQVLKCFQACADLCRHCGVLCILHFHPYDTFAGKHDIFALDHDPQSLSNQTAQLAYCMAEHPKAFYGICLWQILISLVWRKCCFCALTLS